MPYWNHIQTRVKSLGNHFFVRRGLPTSKKQMVGPFIFWDHIGPVHLKAGTEMVVRPHPHIGLATLTYLFSGSILHRDSLNNECLIKPGEVNWMTAGRGITHSERSQEAGNMEGIQLWIALPKADEDVAPSFEHYDKTLIPEFEHDNTDFKLIAGHFFNLQSPVQLYSSLFYLRAIPKEDTQINLNIEQSHESAIYICSGEIKIDGSTFGQGSLLYFEQGQALSFKAQKNANIMIFGGEPFPEKRYIWWNLVSSSEAKIEKAKKMWKHQAFAKVYNEPDDLYIPLPEK